MSLVVTGGTGQLGRLVIESLLARGVAPADIVTGGRSLDKVKDLADRGVQVRNIDYNDPETLAAAFAGAEKVLFVSGSDPGVRVPQHQNVVDAAKAAGVGLLVYTSAPYAATTSMLLADEHRQTEAYIQASGVPYTFLRNGWYFENYIAQIPTYQQLGAIYGAAGEGRVSAAPRSDFAEAGAAVLTAGDHAGKIYELGGDESFSLPELAAAVTASTGTTIEYRELPLPDLEKALLGAGLPAPLATIIADVDRAVAAGELLIDSGDLSRLIGHPTGSLADALAKSA